MTQFIHFQKSVPLPIEFITKYMISANATYVKVYLYGLAQCYEAGEVHNNAAIAEALDILETDVSKAWRYWKRVGLIHSEGRGSIVYDPILPTGAVPPAEKKETAAPEKESAPAPDSAQVKTLFEAMKINPQMKDTVNQTERLMGKPLTQKEIATLYNIMDWYNMSNEMIMVLVEYCVNIEKTSFAYIEKVARRWNEEGITTISAGTEQINRAASVSKMKKKCKKMFGIERAFTAAEEKYISAWVLDYSMTEALIKCAYERTVNNTGKLSMPYMNTILRSWHEKGIKTASAADADRKKAPRTQTYEHDDAAAIERRLRLAKQKK